MKNFFISVSASSAFVLAVVPFSTFAAIPTDAIYGEISRKIDRSLPTGFSCLIQLIMPEWRQGF